MDTRDALLTAAEDVCRKRGYDGFSYADLAREVGIRKASIHHHFPTKADLAVALIDSYSDAFFAALERIEQRHETSAGRLRAYLSRYRRALEGGESVCLCVSMSLGRDRLSDAGLAGLKRFHERSHAWLLRAFEQAQSDQGVRDLGAPVDEARACLAMVEGAQLIARALGRSAAFDHAVKTFSARLAA
ncbi:MAG: TetR/AcrR family transcriptional regulator [Pseudomonadota bacterium]